MWILSQNKNTIQSLIPIARGPLPTQIKFLHLQSAYGTLKEFKISNQEFWRFQLFSASSPFYKYHWFKIAINITIGGHKPSIQDVSEGVSYSENYREKQPTLFLKTNDNLFVLPFNPLLIISGI